MRRVRGRSVALRPSPSRLMRVNGECSSEKRDSVAAWCVRDLSRIHLLGEGSVAGGVGRIDRAD